MKTHTLQSTKCYNFCTLGPSRGTNMPDTYIPSALGPFDEFADNFLQQVQSDPAAFGLTPAQATELATSYASFTAQRAAYNAAKSALDGASEAQSQGRADLTTLLRTLAQLIQNRADTTDEQRRELRLPIRKDGPTPVPAPASMPTLRVEVERGGRHELIFSDANTPNSDRKPDGVMGCEIHEWVGADAPTDYAAWPLVGIDTHNPYLRIHSAAQTGQDAVYVGRWLNAKGEPGPWGQPTSAQTVTR